MEGSTEKTPNICNPFQTSSVAQRYQKGRPYFHPHVMQRIKTKLEKPGLVNLGLDVGCGTGLSSVALLEIADFVVAIDESQAMLDNAIRNSKIEYICQRAENINSTRQFDVITLSQVVHWTDHDIFFSIAEKLLKPDGLLVIYDDFFLWRLGQEHPLNSWFRNQYARQFPSPPRKSISLGKDGRFEPAGFKFAGYEEFSHQEVMSKDRLIDYLITQSNMSSAVRDDAMALKDATTWLSMSLAPLFSDSDEIGVDFGGPIYYLRKT